MWWRSNPCCHGLFAEWQQQGFDRFGIDRFGIALTFNPVGDGHTGSQAILEQSW
jgi:hypothetical protein